MASTLLWHPDSQYLQSRYDQQGWGPVSGSPRPGCVLVKSGECEQKAAQVSPLLPPSLGQLWIFGLIDFPGSSSLHHVCLRDLLSIRWLQQPSLQTFQAPALVSRAPASRLLAVKSSHLVQIPALSLSSCVTMGKSLSSQPRFSPA